MASTPSVQRSDGSLVFCVLACLLTWALSTPAMLHFLERTPLTPAAVAGAGLSAFGPLVAALLVAATQGRIRSIFTPFRAPLHWIVLGLFAPMLSHLAATALFVGLGGPPAQWFHPPVTPEHVAALVVFSIGEEFGWRGFLQPRLAHRYGPVLGSLLVGVVWALWHLTYCVTPEAASFSLSAFLLGLLKLPLWSVIIAWMRERARVGLAVALAFHAGAHLDNLQRALPIDWRLHGLHIALLAILSALAARSLTTATPGALDSVTSSA